MPDDYRATRTVRIEIPLATTAGSVRLDCRGNVDIGIFENEFL